MKNHSIQIFGELFRERRFFELSDELEKYSDRDFPELLFYRGAIANKLNRLELSIDLLEEYLKTVEPAGERLRDCYELLGDGFAKSCRYERAAAMFEAALDCLDEDAGADKRNNLEYLNDLWSAARRFPPQTITFEGDTRVQATRGKVPLLHVPLEISGQTIEFVFDCGADVSSIAASLAARLGLPVIDADISVAGASCRSRAKLALAPTVKFGKVALGSVFLLVIEDEDFYIEKHDYQIQGILGYLAIAACRQVTIERNDEIFIPAKVIERRAERNLLIDEMKPILKTIVDDQPMTFFFDSGAAKTKFFAKFFASRKTEIERLGKPQSGSLSGVGGSRDFPAYTVDELSLRSDDKILKFKEAVIFTAASVYQSEFHDGNIGQDWIAQFEKTTLDFVSMSIIFE